MHLEWIETLPLAILLVVTGASINTITKEAVYPEMPFQAVYLKSHSVLD